MFASVLLAVSLINTWQYAQFEAHVYFTGVKSDVYFTHGNLINARQYPQFWR